MNRVVNWIDRHALHPSLRQGDGDRLRRGRLLVLVTWLLVVPNLVFTVLYLFTGKLPDAMGCGIIGASYALALALVRRRGALETATHFIAGPLILIVLPQVVANGGILSLAVWPWILLGVLTAFLLGGSRVGRVWAAVHFTAVTLCVLKEVVAPTTDTETIAISTFSVGFLSVMLIGIATMYERLKDHMVASLREASAHSRLVLDNIGDGFLLVKADGTLTAERSVAAEHWFGAAGPDVRIWDYLLEGENERLGLMLGWEEIVAEVMPRDLLISQMPKRTTRGARTFSIQYCVVGDTAVEAIVVVVRDITLALVGLRAEEERAEQMQLFELVARDPDGFRDFLRDARQLLGSLSTTTDLVQQRVLHTLKGNAGQVGARTVASICHQLEERLAAGDEIRAEDTLELARRIDSIGRRFSAILVEPGDRLQVDPDDVSALRAALRRRAGPAEIDALLDGWLGDSASQRLGRIAEQARTLGLRLGRGELDVSVQASGIRFPTGRLDDLFAAFSHLIRNAVDHGIEPRDERLRCGKPPVGALRLTADRTSDALVITLVDDGRGVDWNRVRERAVARGLPSTTPAELADALFVDGLSTRDAVDEISGRGIGMSAVKQAVVALGGAIRVDSTLGSGTIVTIAVPAAAVFGTSRAPETLVPLSH